MSKDKQSFKSACRLLTKTLGQDGIILPHSKILDIVAKSWGHNDYQTYLRHQEKDEFRFAQPYRCSRVYVTYVSHDEDAKKTGGAIVSVLMDAFNNYYSKASMPKNMAHKKHQSFPMPAVDYRGSDKPREFLLVLEWMSGPDGLGPNAGIEFNVAFAIPYLYQRHPELFSLIRGLEVVENRATKADITPYLTNKELLAL